MIEEGVEFEKGLGFLKILGGGIFHWASNNFEISLVQMRSGHAQEGDCLTMGALGEGNTDYVRIMVYKLLKRRALE